MHVAFPTRRRDTRAREQCARPARPERASSGGRFDRVPRAHEHGAHVRQASPARRADGTAPQPCRAPRAPCVVVLINQVATRTKEVLVTSGLVPALGEASAHIRNVQVSQIAVTADGIRSADPSSKLLTPPRPVEAVLAPPQLQRWPDAAAAPRADGRLRPSRAAGARHAAGARASELQQQRRREPAATAARTIKSVMAQNYIVFDCTRERYRRYSVCGITFRAKMQLFTLNIAKIFAPAAGRPPPIPHQKTSVYTLA